MHIMDISIPACKDTAFMWYLFIQYKYSVNYKHVLYWCKYNYDEISQQKSDEKSSRKQSF